MEMEKEEKECWILGLTSRFLSKETSHERQSMKQTQNQYQYEFLPDPESDCLAENQVKYRSTHKMQKEKNFPKMIHFASKTALSQLFGCKLFPLRTLSRIWTNKFESSCTMEWWREFVGCKSVLSSSDGHEDT